MVVDPLLISYGYRSWLGLDVLRPCHDMQNSQKGINFGITASSNPRSDWPEVVTQTTWPDEIHKRKGCLNNIHNFFKLSPIGKSRKWGSKKFPCRLDRLAYNYNSLKFGRPALYELSTKSGKETYCINCWCSRYWNNQELSELVS